MNVPETASFVSVPARGEVSAAFVRPDPARALLVYAHGAGAGIHHPFMRDTSHSLAARGIATLRYQFPYMEAGRRLPDRPPILVETVRAAVDRARALAPGLPLLAGGKSLGGRMTSTAAAERRLAAVHGIVFFGFPLHPSTRPSIDRAAHLSEVGLPMLFLQGTRDALADLTLLEPIVADLEASLHVVDGADHSFRVLRRSGRTDEEVLDELADAVSGWVDGLLPG